MLSSRSKGRWTLQRAAEPCTAAQATDWGCLRYLKWPLQHAGGMMYPSCAGTTSGTHYPLQGCPDPSIAQWDTTDVCNVCRKFIHTPWPCWSCTRCPWCMSALPTSMENLTLGRRIQSAWGHPGPSPKLCQGRRDNSLWSSQGTRRTHSLYVH